MRNRQEEIRAKGFTISQGEAEKSIHYREGWSGFQNFNKIKLNSQTLDDAILNLGSFRKVNPRLADKRTVLRAIDTYDLKTMREISDFFYKTSGIYARILRYMAFMYCYDWYVTPYVNDDKDIKKEKLLTTFYQVLTDLDNFNVKKTLGEIALKVLRFGVYYGYKEETKWGTKLQELPYNYCRSQFFCGDKPAVEFNMRYFDDKFRDTEQKVKILKVFGPEFIKGYQLYKLGKLPPEFPGDDSGWYLLDIDKTVKFNANGEDYPMFISVIPMIIDLDAAQDLDRRKVEQRLLKVLIQKMPVDKNGDLIFDVDEAQQLHDNAVQMLAGAIGVNVLTTFADVSVESVSDSNAATSQSDDLERVERQVYNEAGVSQKQFNTDGNIALEKSILNDEATIYNLVLQFECFLNDLIKKYNTKPKKINFKAQILKTTIYNYKELSKLYKEQTQLGYSKILPQLALGQSQSSILANAFFENDVLDLVNVFIPPLMSSTLNENILNRVGGSNKGNPAEEKKAGRKELDNDQKSEKTIQNKESQS